jgi:hypothetical protein
MEKSVQHVDVFENLPSVVFANRYMVGIILNELNLSQKSKIFWSWLMVWAAGLVWVIVLVWVSLHDHDHDH